jgi:hypothetical protein
MNDMDRHHVNLVKRRVIDLMRVGRTSCSR